MENFGCITFRETLLLVDPNAVTQGELRSVAMVIAHELAHMWFGDLVTMRWWNGIWLNEAFATFMEIAACDAYRPDWQRWTSFGLERTAAFETDSLANTRSVEYEVRSPADCEGMFDVLTYQKGSALLRMLEQYLAPEHFREGVAHYLRTHSYGNTETNDLWDAIEETSGRPVRRMMDSWIWQPGYPIVDASLSATPDGAALRLAQRRFVFDADAPATGDAQLWVVPVHVRQGDGTSVHVLESTGDPLTVPLDDPSAPVVVNAGGHGFFRVAYDGALRDRLDGDALASMSTIERYNLVDDAWSATVAGDLSATALLVFLEAFRDEREYAVWQAVIVALRGLGRLVDGEALIAFQARVRTLVSPALVALGDPSPDEDDLLGKLRGLLTSALGALGNDPAVLQRCREIYDAAADEPGSTDPELLAAATNVVAAFGDASTFARMIDGYTGGATPQDQLRHLYALAEFDDAELVQRACEYAMSSAVKTQNAPYLLRLAIANRHHGPLAWNFVRTHWSEANERFPTNTIVRMIDSVKLLNTPEVVADVQGFFAEHRIEQAVKTQDQILERQRVNAAMRARNEQELAAHLTG
jgi:puromycin-sensitive aminopeptidase